MKKIIPVFAILVFSIQANTQKLMITGDSYLELNGERFRNQKIVFTKADGDWYATVNDGHGTISLYGMYDGRELRLDMEWDGKKDLYPVNNENRHHQREAEFLISLPDKTVYSDGLNSTPSGDDEVSIRIDKVDDRMVAGVMKGRVTEDGKPVNVTGVFHLGKNSSRRITSATYLDCDPVVYDKLIGAEGRSPSSCEAKYSLDVRTGIHDAIAPMVAKMEEAGWIFSRQTNLDPLTIVGRGSEKYLFNTTYEMDMNMSPSSSVYASYQEKMDNFTEEFKHPAKDTYERFSKLSHEMNSAIRGFMRVSVNNTSFGFGNYRGGAKVTSYQPNVYVIQSTYVQSLTGGGEDASVDVTFVLIGRWKQPVIQKEEDGGETIHTDALLSPDAPKLQTHNLVLRMECNALVAGEMLKNLDLQKLKSMLGYK